MAARKRASRTNTANTGEASGSAPAKKEKALDVIRGNEYIRTYSAEDHGKDYEVLAKKFAKKFPDVSIKKAGEIKRLVVEYEEKDPENENRVTAKREVFGGKNFKEEALAFKNTVRGTIRIG